MRASSLQDDDDRPAGYLDPSLCEHIDAAATRYDAAERRLRSPSLQGDNDDAAARDNHDARRVNDVDSRWGHDVRPGRTDHDATLTVLLRR
jgi:hypothetical protein